ncbi:patatin-like phospholipase family protein [Piscinibacter aquaticus]|uniref:Patatin-like phospholipase family protein n=1 Tax=Piscinibacter aquaticus TaxID=392597 RepID=A0A5C6U0J7_9BURK|nr:patatin-like phospholipase family protein [Piscinibacter aquaticus]
MHTPREPGGGSETAYRAAAGEPDWTELSATRGFGLALSGGGSKASAFAMGVLAGLNDAGMLVGRAQSEPDQKKTPRVEIISSVSGGGYSAYWLFSQLAHFERSGESSIDRYLNAMFLDCLTAQREGTEPYFSDVVKAALERGFRCDSSRRYALKPIDLPTSVGPLAMFKPQNRFQFHLRCGQDILQPGECSAYTTTEERASTLSAHSQLLVSTLGLAVPHHFANSLFDWGVNLAPSRKAYRDGMGLTYGAVPTQDYAVRVLETDKNGKPTLRMDVACPSKEESPDTALMLRGCFRNTEGRPEPDALKFSELAALWSRGRNGQGPHSPFWVIQSTAAGYRGISGVFSYAFRDVPNDTFEFTPLGFGSRRFGFVKGHLEGFDALEATTSAAAFLDSAQSSLGNRLARPALNSAQYLLNANWGTDIPNYSVGDGRRRLHQALPFPLNTVDSLAESLFAGTSEKRDRIRSTWIRLLDGGNADNTGLFALLRRGVRAAVLSDAAHDARVFDDLCVLRLQLLASETEVAGAPNPNPLYLHVPALTKFGEHCLQHTEKERGYSFWEEWPTNSSALLACISKSRDDTDCQFDDKTVMRIVVLKPHLNLQHAYNEAFGESKALPARVIRRCQYQGRLFTETSNPDTPPPLCDEKCAAIELPCEVAYYYRRDGDVHSLKR